MDCQTALEQLECVRPDSNDLDLPELADAREHLEGCESCAEKFAAMQEFDRSVSAVVQDVPVPDRLRASLLEAADPGAVEAGAKGADSATSGDEESESRNPLAVSSREAAESDQSSTPDRLYRRVQRLMTAACALLIAAIAALWWNTTPVTFAGSELLQRLPLELSETAEFDQRFEFVLPATWSANHRLRVGRPLRGVNLDEAPGHEAAIAVFQFSRGREAPVSGILAAVPSDRVQPLPSASTFQGADARYVQKAGRRPVAALWRERSTVYVCFVLGSAADLEQIQESLAGSAA